MTIPQLIQLAERRIAYLESVKSSAEKIGDVDAVIRADTEISEAQETLTKLRSIPAP